VLVCWRCRAAALGRAELWPAWARFEPGWAQGWRILGFLRWCNRRILIEAFSALSPAWSASSSRHPPGHGAAMRYWRQGGPDLAWLGPTWVLQTVVAAYLFLARSWRVCAVGASSWRVTAAQVAGLLVGGARVRAGRDLTSSFFPRVSGSQRSCSGAAVYLYCFGRTISVLSWRAVVLLRRWLTCSSSSTSCLMWWLQLVSFFARVWFPTRVKALLDFANADHGDTRGCHFLLGGVLLGRTAPPSMPGETLGPLCRTG
jgi:hypothetical protein